ncbi:hypothetical protein LCGC14_0693810 [marine sediment metagenome]|uniref:Uncharacterized protein n=1 Tax=marine sediment metagenome TaxID=412755 RepID=A0A0F9QJV9_9ZZZZ
MKSKPTVCDSLTCGHLRCDEFREWARMKADLSPAVHDKLYQIANTEARTDEAAE